MEDRALVYRGADQPDLSVINPESDVWQHIKVIISSPVVAFNAHVLMHMPYPDTAELLVDELAYTILCAQQ